MDRNPVRMPNLAWLGIVLSMLVSITTFAFSTGVQAQRIVALESKVERQEQQVIQTPAILNELVNINRRLGEMSTAIDKLNSRR